MNIGKQIKKLRCERDLTQEQFAEVMNVSTSAVSQWESDKTVPDISTILSIANYFDVTLDYLFERNELKKEKELEEYRRKSAEYGNQGEIYNQVALWREAVNKYPGNFECLINLAGSLVETYYCGTDKAAIEASGLECVKICEGILLKCTDDAIRQRAISMLVETYSRKKMTFANEENAVKYAKKSCRVGECADELLEIAYFTEASSQKRMEQKHKNILNYMDMLTMKLYYGNFNSPEEKIENCKLALSLWQLLIPDGNYLFFHCRIKKIYQGLAIGWAELGNRENTLNALKSIVYHSICSDNIPKGIHHYTSRYVSAAIEDSSLWSKNYTVSDKKHAIYFMQRKEFDFLKDDAEYIEILNS